MPRDTKTLAAGVEAFLGRPGAVTTVDTLAAGHSNETYRLGGIDMILRTPPEAGPAAALRHEATTRRARGHPASCTRRAGARVYGVCTDEKFIGAPFYLCSAMRGESFEYEAPAWLAECTLNSATGCANNGLRRSRR